MATNKEIVIDFSKRLWEQRDLTVIDELFIPETVILSPLNPPQVHLTMRQIANKWLEAFPDISIHWLDFISEGDQVVSRWRAKGTHLGGFFATKPTHHEVSYSGITCFKVKNQKIIEYSALVDIHAILKQLGVERLSEAMEG